LSYLNVPIMAKYYVIEKLSLEAGPQIGFLLSAKNQVDDLR
ncbi:MAG: PorT family protein, partial [Flavobacterium sp.]